jgi:hypothetical protein
MREFGKMRRLTELWGDSWNEVQEWLWRFVFEIFLRRLDNFNLWRLWSCRL